VQCITNSVAANYTANVLLASGASPAMIDNPYEAESFTKISSALSINLGTPTSEQMQAMQISAKTAQLNNIPWVLDPVGYGPVLAWRSQMTDELLQFKPGVIRGNASEISTLAGNQVQSKGVDSTLSSDDAYRQAYALLAHTDCIAISGESDYILSKELDVVIQVNGGSPLQPKITATGCALGALIAAYNAVTTPTIAALSAHVHFAIAGKLAANQAQTMGSFSNIFMDYIHMLDANLIEQYANIKLLGLKA
ncbi:MAG: hydroxyethylthiazole kinase, partial [Acinetobacter oleivorans]|nr:hydroxyethylthiazole kinase [Acinetobacter oleivorans]